MAWTIEETAHRTRRTLAVTSLTQAELAAKLDVTVGSVNSWANGNGAPKEMTRRKMRALHDLNSVDPMGRARIQIDGSRVYILPDTPIPASAGGPSEPSAIPGAIAALLRRLDCSKAGLAGKIRVNPGTLSGWIAGRFVPSVKHRRAMAALLS